MASELKPCPFCDTRAILQHKDRERQKRIYWVKCPSCHVSMRGFYDETDAIAAWNRRAAPPSEEGSEPTCGCSSLQKPCSNHSIAAPPFRSASR